MNKKNYAAPQIQVVRILADQALAAASGLKLHNEQTVSDDSADWVDAAKANRHQSVWMESDD